MGLGHCLAQLIAPGNYHHLIGNPTASDSGLPQTNYLKAWWKADALAYSDNGVTLAADLASVYLWKDQFTNTFIQPTTGNQGVYHTNAINGKPAIYLRPSATTSFYWGTNYNGATFQDHPSTLFLVFTLGYTNDFGYLLDKYPSGNTPEIFYANNVDKLEFVNASGGTYPTAVVKKDTWYYASMTFNGTNSIPRLNGTQYTAQNTGSGIPFSNWRLGSNYFAGGAGGNYWKGYIAEIIYYTTALASNDVVTVETYLKTKYGL